MKILFAPFAARLPNGARSPKDYPFAVRLNELLEQSGHEVIQVGSNQEPTIAKQFKRSLSFVQVSDLLRDCDTFIGVDSYLQHHAWFVGRRGIVLWGPSDPKIFGHGIHVNLLKNRDFVRPHQFEMWTQTTANPDAFVKPDVVMFWVRRIAQELADQANLR